MTVSETFAVENGFPYAKKMKANCVKTLTNRKEKLSQKLRRTQISNIQGVFLSKLFDCNQSRRIKHASEKLYNRSNNIIVSVICQITVYSHSAESI